MAEPVKRLNYFDHQFLHVEDFLDEQRYHLRMRRLHNSLLHTWGVARGLELSFEAGGSTVQVSEGIALDGQGRELVLPSNTRTSDLSAHAGKFAYVTITYGEAETDYTDETGAAGNRRRLEQPSVRVDAAPPADPSERVVLGRALVGADGKVTGVDAGQAPTVRRTAGVVGGELEVRSLAVTSSSIEASRWVRMRLASTDRAELTGSLTVSGALTVQTTLTVTGAVNPAGTPLSVGTGATPANLLVTGDVTVGAGRDTVLRVRTIAGKGATHDGDDVLRLQASNGRAVTVGAAATPAALQVSGDVTVGSGRSATLRTRHIDGKGGTDDSADLLALNWGNSKPVTVGSQGAAAPLHVHGELVVRAFPTNDSTPLLTRIALIGRRAGGAEQNWSLFTAAVGGGWGVTPNAFEIWEYPATRQRLSISPGGDTFLTPTGGKVFVGGELRLPAGGTISAPGRLHIAGEELLYVLNKSGMIIGKEWGGTGNLHVQGDLLVTGRIGSLSKPATPLKAGWGGGLRTWDVEAEGTVWSRHSVQTGPRDLAEYCLAQERLEPGDVVRLHVDDDLVERTTAAHDALVAGIVSTEPGVLLGAVPEDDPEGRYPIALAGRVPCKVTAEGGPIRRGDLLGSSSTPGHAMRIDPPAITGGTILGKALQDLDTRLGVIDVLVTLA
jgi:hypothetical protein